MRIKTITIDGNVIPLSNMVIIVGSNGTGKTRLLEELNWAFTQRGDKTNFWTIQFVKEVGSGDISKWFENIIYHQERNTKEWYYPFTRSDSALDGITLPDDQYQMYAQDYDKFSKDYEFQFIKEYIHYLPVALRLSVPGGSSITPPNQRINNILDLLLKTPEILNEVNIELEKTFKKKVEIMPHMVPNIELRVFDNDIEGPPRFDLYDSTRSYQQYNGWIKKHNIVPVSKEGHGIQAFLTIMLTYCIPINDILLIDEPEIHLYPSIKRKFGNSLGDISQRSKKQFICVTHDSDFLQGVLDSKCEATIIRIKKTGKARELFFKHISSDVRYLAGQNQTPFLQIPFLDAAIIVEGATDRLVYESVFFDNKLLSNIEYKFISAGGKDGITNPERIAHDLHVPYAVILDIENLKDKENAHLQKHISIRENAELLKEISNIGQSLRGIPDLTKKGVDAILDKDTRERTVAIINALKAFGIFVVHKGTLESWRKVNNEPKNQFPEKFIEEYQRDRNSFQDMISFLMEIERYLMQFQ